MTFKRHWLLSWGGVLAGNKDIWANNVRFTNDDGSTCYYATYTAYDGRVTFPQMLETEDFLHFRVSTLNGPEVRNKGFALFPRMVNGQYAMLSRQDNPIPMISSPPYPAPIGITAIRTRRIKSRAASLGHWSSSRQSPRTMTTTMRWYITM